MIERKNPLLDTFVDAENGGESVDGAIRKLDKDLDHVIDGLNGMAEEVKDLQEALGEAKGLNPEEYARKEELPQIVGGSGIEIGISGQEHRISARIPVVSAESNDPGLMSRSDKDVLEMLRNAGEASTAHLHNEGIHVPEGDLSQDIGKVMTFTEAGPEWQKGTSGGDTDGVVSINSVRGAILLEGEGMTAIQAIGSGRIQISTPTVEEASPEKSGLLSALDKEKLNSLPSIPAPTEEDKGKVLTYQKEGSFSWEFQTVHHIGEIFAYGGIIPPIGSVECRGQVMSKTVHPDLFAIIGYHFGGAGDLFHLPDTYTAARFLRSRSGGLPIGTTQGDAIRNITGYLSTRPGASGWTVSTITTDNALFTKSGTADSAGRVASESGAATWERITFNAAKTGIPTAEENRPINVAVMYCIQITHGYVNSTRIDVASLQQEVMELRNQLQYPPMFIQGFQVNYVDAATVRIGEGSCRSDDNRFNIDYSGASVEISGLAPTSDLPRVHIYVILKEDGTTTFVSENSAELTGAKAKRRICSFYSKDTTGIPAFDSIVTGQSIAIYYREVHVNMWTYKPMPEYLQPLTIPAGITGSALVRLRVDSGGGTTTMLAEVTSLIAATEADSVISNYTASRYSVIPYGKKDSDQGRSVYFRCGSNNNFDPSSAASIGTRGYIDWRVD